MGTAQKIAENIVFLGYQIMCNSVYLKFKSSSKTILKKLMHCISLLIAGTVSYQAIESRELWNKEEDWTGDFGNALAQGLVQC